MASESCFMCTEALILITFQKNKLLTLALLVQQQTLIWKDIIQPAAPGHGSYEPKAEPGHGDSYSWSLCLRQHLLSRISTPLLTADTLTNSLHFMASPFSVLLFRQ